MQVHKGPPPKPWTPIVLTIESEDEAKILWAEMNSPLGNIVDDLRSMGMRVDKDGPMARISDLHQEMWSKFNNLYEPHKSAE